MGSSRASYLPSTPFRFGCLICLDNQTGTNSASSSSALADLKACPLRSVLPQQPCGAQVDAVGPVDCIYNSGVRNATVLLGELLHRNMQCHFLNMPTNSGKTVLITGCSAGGIGSALAQAFHDQGCRVFATARALPKIAHLRDMGIDVLQLDVEDAASIASAVDRVGVATEGTLDLLVNNAGLGQSGPIIDSNLADSRKMFEVNFFGRVATTQAFAPLLIKAKGTIVNIGSIAGVCPQPWKGMYNASSAAVHQWSDTLRIELEPFGVRVVLVVTGAVRTNFLTNQAGAKVASDSIYAPAKESIESAMNGKSVDKNFVDAHGYAREVVANVLRKHPVKRHWAGGVARLIWAVSVALWATAWDFLLAEQFAINELRKRLALKNVAEQ
ncbi:hypothetical protein JDV02_009012 [Purpureocillium takamizusanense]|uniref:NADPH-dependent 1-acyldihydroxyacetone phosphate reductase n=1 Tax=Purpureocillium takamizusanense TaxID=2060973 RepID=A0A9Q8VFU9_9HYPO|nr:uncharacterized protein JDV02_009012 [Purpureocillium takamizusanense]UNI23177.1 hypothetical protein JDV02_009012 [Purpureocillium takamizusanense]